jgi:hypothetical protein
MAEEEFEMNEPPSVPGPLSEASASSLDEFFSRRPPFDEGALTAMVAELRRMREKWESLGEGVKVTKKAKAPVKAASSPAQLSAEDLWANDSEETPK